MVSLKLEGVSRLFGDVKAVKDVSLEIQKGETDFQPFARVAVARPRTGLLLYRLRPDSELCST